MQFIRPHKFNMILNSIMNPNPNLDPSVQGRGEWSEWDNNAHNNDEDDLEFEGNERTKPDVPRSSGSGEWADWDNNAHNIDPDFDDEANSVAATTIPVWDASSILSKQLEPQSLPINSDSSTTVKPPQGRGEWADWSGEGSFDGDIYDESEDNIVQEKALESPSKWEWWNEEAPYFDENDYIDEDGNVGRKENVLQQESWTVEQTSNSNWDMNQIYAIVNVPASTIDLELSLLPLLSKILHVIGRPWTLSYLSVETNENVSVFVDQMNLPLTAATLRYVAYSTDRLYSKDLNALEKLRIDLALELTVEARKRGENDAEFVCNAAGGFMAGRNWLVGNEMSLGDLALFDALSWTQNLNPSLLFDRPDLLAYVRRIRSVLPVRAAL